MTVGIPRALLYHIYRDLWINFFKNLNIEVIISPPTNRAIIKKGMDNSIDEGCYSSKIYVGHVEYLLDKCDMIFVPRVENCAIKEEYCTRLFGIYDLIRNTFPQAKLLNANVNYLFRKRESDAFVEIGRQLGKTAEQSLEAYELALRVASENKAKKIVEQQERLRKPGAKVLLLSHAYNTFDAMVGQSVVKYFEDSGVTVIYADLIDEKTAKETARSIYRRIYWKVSAELLGGLVGYKDQVDGIVLLSTFPCMPDSIMNELIIRTTKDKPILSLMIDELDATAGLLTRLESFTDIISAKRRKTENAG